jgi:hypothetical protein
MESEQLTLFQPDTLASLSVLPGTEKARKMTVTSGRKLLDSYRKSSPVGSLVRMLLDTSLWGSTMCFLTWKAKVTKQSRLYFQLVPSTPRINETESSLWATPSASDSQGSHGGGQGRSLRTDIWEWKKGMWPTPKASDSIMGMTARTSGRPIEKSTHLQTQVHLQTKLWPTPRANDAEKRGSIADDPRNGLPAAAMWGTPTATSYKGSSQYGTERWNEEIKRGNIKGQVMEPNNKGQLNPEWVECLMGFPIGWTDLDGQQD